MTKFGNPLTVIILFACAALWMWYKKKGRNILVRFWIYCNCWNHQPGDQTIFMRERPSLAHLVVETSYSFLVDMQQAV